ncbi:MAG: DNA repair protein RecO [Patescibacteria group bacterium]
MLSIVLARRDFKENDQIISLFTEEKGKMEVLARGVKKIVSKNSAFLEPFFLVEAEIIPGKEVFHLGSVQPVNSFKKIRADLGKSLLASYAVKLLDKLIPTLFPERQIFKLLASWLEFLDKTKSPGSFLLDAFVLKLFYFLGFDITKVKKLSLAQKKSLTGWLKAKWSQIGEEKGSLAQHTLIYRFAVYHSERKLKDWQKLANFSEI